mmetsp:Transcript_22659/g.49075  ORF Transcript_22659/g.49075 Transcript_22659/m.49075 type:complete len:204 (+) Transcript_22659:50-661(+)
MPWLARTPNGSLFASFRFSTTVPPFLFLSFAALFATELLAVPVIMRSRQYPAIPPQTLRLTVEFPDNSEESLTSGAAQVAESSTSSLCSRSFRFAGYQPRSATAFLLERSSPYDLWKIQFKSGMMLVGSRDSRKRDAKTNLPLVVWIIDICDESQIKTTLVAVHHKYGDGTIGSAWEEIEFIEVFQYFDKNLTSDAATLGGKG